MAVLGAEEGRVELLWLVVAAVACTQALMARAATAGRAPRHAATTTGEAPWRVVIAGGTPWRRRAVATTHGGVQRRPRAEPHGGATATTGRALWRRGGDSPRTRLLFKNDSRDLIAF